jgi:hypothetical protein
VRRGVFPVEVGRQRPSRRPAAPATSLSDDDEYPDFCWRAATQSEVFASFRRAPEYMSVLGLDARWGREYFDALPGGSRAARLIPQLAAEDVVGNPIPFTLPSGLEIAPTTLRYLKFADDIERLFGSLDGWDLCEIGVGYGGQCRVLDAMWAPRAYTLVDLRPALALAERFLGHFPLRTTVRFLTMNELDAREHDLLVSTYAYSELTGDIQEGYFRKVVEGSRRGFVVFNDLGASSRRGMSAEELCERVGGRMIPEEPLTHPQNRVVIWGG